MNIARHLLCAVGFCLLSTGCSSPDDASESEGSGKTALGGTCVRASDCQPVEGKEVGCACTESSPETVCALLLDRDEPCGSGKPGCRSDSVCVSRNGTAQCEAYAKVGESCEKNYCAAGGTCVEGKCAAAHSAGQACSPFEPAPCAEGLYCEFLDAVCKPIAAEGQPCSGKDECGNDGVCMSVNGTPAACIRLKADGEACEWASDCRDGSACTRADGGTERCAPKTTADKCGGSSWP